MTTYTKRDIRAADMLAILLVGFGVVWILFAALPLLVADSGKASGANLALWLVAGVFLALGMALNRKIHQLVGNQLREPEGPPEALR